jgi:hypothetical protein
MRTLSQVADVIRSKNAGPFIVTFDILFANREDFEAVRAAGRLSRATVCKLYGVSDNALVGFEYYPFANAVKFSIQRAVSAGGPRDADAYGAQQHAPLLDLPVLPD